MSTNIVPIRGHDLEVYQARQIQLMKRTVASDCNDDEFRMFIHAAKNVGLDPLRKQIYAFVFSKDNPKKRKLTIVTGIDGFRSVAMRHGDYRPDDDEPQFEINEEFKSPLNPEGIVKAKARVYKQDSKGDWHAIVAVARWDEFAPIKEDWAWDEAARKRLPTGKLMLDDSGQWGKMPFHMLAKCAEAQAIRRGWPDDLSNIYEHAEIDQSKILDIDPVEAVAEADREDRFERLGGHGIMIQFSVSDPLEGVPVGELADRVIGHIQQQDNSAKLAWFMSTNQEPLRHLWATDKDAALSVKQAAEKQHQTIQAAEQEVSD